MQIELQVPLRIQVGGRVTPRQVIDDGFMPPNELRTGRAESSVEPAPSSFDGVRAILWLPDPEQRHGWREFYVRDSVPAKPGGRVGF